MILYKIWWKLTNFTNEDDIIGAKKGGPLDKLMDKGHLVVIIMAGTRQKLNLVIKYIR
jgi:hypothetical protein